MSPRSARSSEFQLYPKRYFDRSPTWNQWNDLTAADVQALRTERGFEGQQIYFHLNHPIRFVRIVGIVVDVEITKGGKHVLISLDDGSGSCIEAKTALREIKPDDDAQYPSNTLVDSLHVLITLGLPSLHVNNAAIDIGTVVNAKGTLDSFRNVRQLKLEMIRVVKDTNEEARTWAKTARWKRDVLSQPWVLTKEQRDAVDDSIRRDELSARERAKRKRAWQAKHGETHRRRQEKLEKRRRSEEDKLNAGALPGSNVIPNRVTDS